jgi:hypothetical protein
MVKAAIIREGTANRLAERVNAMNRDAGLRCRISRKTLVRIRDCPEHVSFNLDNLTALNTYFAARGESLQDKPIFEKRGVLDVIGSSPQVIFLLGSKPRLKERRDDISRWDNLALAELLTAVSRFRPHSEYLIEDVIWRWPATGQSLADDRFQMALNDDQASIISIGSPLASLSSEIMLARMFGVEAFTTPNFGPQLSLLPFYFVWRPQVAKRFRSAFALTWRELLPVDRKLALQVKSGRTSCFLCGKRRYLVPAEENSWTVPGIIAAQRRAAGNVWLVLAGLAGPATFAAASLVKHITTELPWREGADSEVLWIPIKAKIKADPANKIGGDVRRVCSTEFAGNPMTFPLR